MAKPNTTGRRAGRISATPKLKKAKHLKKLRVSPANAILPAKGNTAVDPLFSGTLFFVKAEFTIQSNNNAVISISDQDLAIAVQYATQAAGPISQYADQYGPNGVAVSPGVVPFAVTLGNPTYSDADLQGWVNAFATANNLPANSCVVWMNPQGVVNSDGDASQGIGGYHSNATLPYIFSNVFGSNFTVADENDVYAQVLSHEIAEMVVDPLANLVNPEVCDPCAGNCNNLFLAFFDDASQYIASAQSLPPAFQYAFFIAAIVQPSSATQCPAPANACDYAP